MSDVWQSDPRPVPPELINPSVHADYSPTPISDRLSGVSIMDRLDEATFAVLRELAHGGIGDV